MPQPPEDPYKNAENIPLKADRIVYVPCLRSGVLVKTYQNDSTILNAGMNETLRRMLDGKNAKNTNHHHRNGYNHTSGGIMIELDARFHRSQYKLLHPWHNLRNSNGTRVESLIDRNGFKLYRQDSNMMRALAFIETLPPRQRDYMRNDSFTRDAMQYLARAEARFLPGGVELRDQLSGTVRIHSLHVDSAGHVIFKWSMPEDQSWSTWWNSYAVCNSIPMAAIDVATRHDVVWAAQENVVSVHISLTGDGYAVSRWGATDHQGPMFRALEDLDFYLGGMVFGWDHRVNRKFTMPLVSTYKNPSDERIRLLRRNDALYAKALTSFKSVKVQPALLLLPGSWTFAYSPESGSSTVMSRFPFELILRLEILTWTDERLVCDCKNSNHPSEAIRSLLMPYASVFKTFASAATNGFEQERIYKQAVDIGRLYAIAARCASQSNKASGAVLSISSTSHLWTNGSMASDDTESSINKLEVACLVKASTTAASDVAPMMWTEIAQRLRHQASEDSLFAAISGIIAMIEGGAFTLQNARSNTGHAMTLLCEVVCAIAAIKPANYRSKDTQDSLSELAVALHIIEFFSREFDTDRTISSSTPQSSGPLTLNEMSQDLCLWSLFMLAIELSVRSLKAAKMSSSIRSCSALASAADALAMHLTPTTNPSQEKAFQAAVDGMMLARDFTGALLSLVDLAYNHTTKSTFSKLALAYQALDGKQALAIAQQYLNRANGQTDGGLAREDLACARRELLRPKAIFPAETLSLERRVLEATIARSVDNMAAAVWREKLVENDIEAKRIESSERTWQEFYKRFSADRD